MISHIVAVSENNIIGVKGNLPWDIPEDMKFFRNKTKGRAIIMGRKTFESLGHPLPHRLNVVVTKTKNYVAPKAVATDSITEAIKICQSYADEYGEEIFIIGGGEIYQQSLDLVDRIYLTRIHKSFEGDTRYPVLNPKDFKETKCRPRTKPIPFSFLIYDRISQTGRL